jgi:hypothetical protein
MQAQASVQLAAASAEQTLAGSTGKLRPEASCKGEGHSGPGRSDEGAGRHVNIAGRNDGEARSFRPLTDYVGTHQPPAARYCEKQAELSAQKQLSIGLADGSTMPTSKIGDNAISYRNHHASGENTQVGGFKRLH